MFSKSFRHSQDEFYINLLYLDPEFYDQKEKKTGYLIECKANIELNFSTQLQKHSLENLYNNLKNDSSLIILEHENFDLLYQLCCMISKIKVEQKIQIQEILLFGISRLLSELRSYQMKQNQKFENEETSEIGMNDSSKYKYKFRNSIRMFAFLACMFVNSCEKIYHSHEKEAKVSPSKKSNKQKNKKLFSNRLNDSSQDQSFEKDKSISSLLAFLEYDELKAVQNMGTPEDEFGMMFFKTGLNLFENTQNLKIESIYKTIHNIIALSVTKFNLFLTYSSSFIHLLMNNEKRIFSSHVAQLCELLALDYKCPLIVGNIIREVGRLDRQNLTRMRKGSESIASFLEELGKRVPQFLLRDISVILPHIDGESYKMRNGIIRTLGKIVKYIVETKNENQNYIDNERGNAEENQTGNIYNESNYEKLIGLIKARCLDVNSFCRSCALRTLYDLVSTDCITHKYLKDLFCITIDRLLDKNANVRKSAINFLCLLIQTYYPQNLDELENKYKEMCSKKEILKKLEKQRQLTEAKKILNENQFLNDNEPPLNDNEQKLIKIDKEKDVKDDEISLNIDLPPQEELNKFYAEIDKISIGIEIIKQVSRCLPFICSLLYSKSLSDLLESINFSIVCSRHKVRNWEDCYRKMLPLIFHSNTESVGKAVLNAFYTRYIQMDLKQQNERQFTGSLLKVSSSDDDDEHNLHKFINIASNLSRLAEADVLRDITCIEELIFQMNKNNMIDPLVFGALQRQFVKNGRLALNIENKSSKSTNTQEIDQVKCLKMARNALTILSMSVAAKPKIMNKHIEQVIVIGLRTNLNNEKFDEHYNLRKKDQQLVLISYKLLEKYFLNCSLSQAKLMEKYHEIILKSIQDTILIDETDKSFSQWFTVCQQALDTLFAMSTNYEQFCQQIISHFFARFFGQILSDIIKFINQYNKYKQIENKCEENNDDSILHTCESIKEEFLNVLSPSEESNYNLIKNLNDKLIDLLAFVIKKYENNEQENGKICENNIKRHFFSYRSNSLTARFLFVLGHIAIKYLVYIEKLEKQAKKANRSKKQNQNSSKSIETELGIGEGEVEHQIEMLRLEAEYDLVHSDLLGSFTKLVIFMCKNMDFFKDQKLVCSISVMTLCKFMCTCKDFCSQNLGLLFQILQDSKNSVVRANIIISLGDLISRFPNTLASHLSNVYYLLRDPDIYVRKTALMVLSHLILNEMIKVKESISEIALLITDSEQQIRDSAKVFFQEFSSKGKNPIYNILPDTISRLSNDSNVSHARFKEILTELMQYVSKERQQENLVQKLCNRFDASFETNQHRDITFCLTLITYKEKCIRKFIDQSKTYQNLIGDDFIQDGIQSIIKKAKIAAIANSTKEMISEFEEKLNEQRKKLESEHGGLQDSKEKHKSKIIQKQKTLLKDKKPKRRRDRSISWSSSESDKENSEFVYFDSDTCSNSESDDGKNIEALQFSDEKNSPIKRKPATVVRRQNITGRRKRSLIYNESEEDSN